MDTPSPETLTAEPCSGVSGYPEKVPVVVKRESLYWHGLKLKQRVTNRTVAIVRRDAEYPAMFRVHLTDHASDICNLARAREAAVDLAVRILNGEVGYHRQRQRRRRKAEITPPHCNVGGSVQ
jgi:hypothetical protein